MWVREAKKHGNDLGLSSEETAFYDALAENGSAKEVMQSDTLRLMARELAEMVKKMPKPPLDAAGISPCRHAAQAAVPPGDVRIPAGFI